MWVQSIGSNPFMSMKSQENSYWFSYRNFNIAFCWEGDKEFFTFNYFPGPTSILITLSTMNNRGTQEESISWGNNEWRNYEDFEWCGEFKDGSIVSKIHSSWRNSWDCIPYSFRTMDEIISSSSRVDINFSLHIIINLSMDLTSWPSSPKFG